MGEHTKEKCILCRGFPLHILQRAAVNSSNTRALEVRKAQNNKKECVTYVLALVVCGKK